MSHGDMHNAPKSHKMRGSRPVDERRGCRESAWDGCARRPCQRYMDTGVGMSVTCGSRAPLGEGRYLPKTSSALRISRRIQHWRMWATGQGRDYSGFPAVCARTGRAGLPHTQLRANSLCQAGGTEMGTGKSAPGAPGQHRGVPGLRCCSGPGREGW